MELQNYIDNSVSVSGNNGVSAHLIMPDGQTWSGTAGLGKDDIPISDTTLFHGASTTKLNISILMLLLAEENMIDLDEPWNNYISLNVAFDTTITVRQLLNHTSGIADYLETPTSGNDITADFSHFFTPQYILENIVSGDPVFPPGTNFQYSNSNYVLAGLIAEEVTGNPVHIELRNRIWDPLGMNHTYFGAYEIYTEPTAGVWWDFGSGMTNYSDMPTTSMLSYAYGAGNIVSCPADLAILLSGLLHGQLLDSQSMNEMMTFVPQSFSSWSNGYGLGIHHQNGQTNDTVLGHDGYYTNLTDMFHSSNYDFTLVTMTNTQTAWFGIYNPMHDVIVNYFTSLDVYETEDKFDLSIYPNPTRNQFKITSTRIITEIEIHDVIGRVIHRTCPDSKDVLINIEKEGLYFVSLRSKNQSISRKVMVMN